METALLALGTSASTAATGSAIFSGLGMVTSALGAIQQGQAAKQSAKYNAEVQQNNAAIARQNATLAGREGAANAAIQQQKTRENVAAIKSAQAGNGVNVNTGSAVDVQSGAAEAGLLNAITVRSNAARQAYGYQTQASSSEAQSELDKAQGKNAETASYVNAGSTLIGSAQKADNSGTWDAFRSKTALNSDDTDLYASTFYGDY